MAMFHSRPVASITSAVVVFYGSTEDAARGRGRQIGSRRGEELWAFVAPISSTS
jgi:hypothetical protein